MIWNLLTFQLWVATLKAGKLQLCGRLDNRLGGGEQRYGALFAVSCPELLTGHHKLTIDALTQIQTAAKDTITKTW